MPGHKGELCDTDITELGFSDNLHNPHGVIKELQDRCASVYAMENAHLLVNGSSAGVCAMLVALSLKLHRKARVLVSRDCHKSFISGAYLSAAECIGVYPELETGGVVTPQIIKDALQNMREKPDAVFITCPNYYGMCADTEAIHEMLKNENILLFADSAHGAHFPFSERLPSVPSADALVVSTHKTLSALNQSGILFCKNELDEAVKTALSMLQTTSPSYPIMASIENAMETGYLFKKHIDRISPFIERLEREGINVLKKAESAKEKDITRLCIMADGIAKDGYALYDLLVSHGIYAEMADNYCVVCITGPCDKDEWYERLFNVLAECKRSYKGKAPDFILKQQRENLEYISVRDAMDSESELTRLNESIGRCACDAVGVYPPGIALIFPGEVITKDAVLTLTEARERGGELFGVRDDMVRVMKYIR